MSQLQKKCFVASVGMHSTLVLILFVGSAFFIPKAKNTPTTFVKMVPSIIVENAMAGGGGDPTIPENNERQKGETLEPQPPPAKPPEPPKPKDPKPEKVEPPKDPVKDPKVVEAKPKNKIDLKDLKEVKPTAQKLKANAAEAKKNDTRRELADKFAKAADELTPTPGFLQGTASKVSGTGGAAYADYRSLVGAVYDDAWFVTDDVADDNTTVVVEVTIAQDGDVISARIVRRSGNAALNRSVESTLSRVKFVRPFPPSWKEKQKTFPINFNLKSKRSAG